MAQPHRRHQLQFPLDRAQVESLSQEIDAIYRRLREISEFVGAEDEVFPAVHLPAFTGDVTKPVGSTVLTIANTGVTAGTYGSVTRIPVVVVNAKGQITGISQVAVTTGILGLLTNGDSLSPELIFDSSGDVITV